MMKPVLDLPEDDTTDRLQIDAYPSGVSSPPEANLFRTTHTTFAVRFRPPPTGQS